MKTKITYLIFILLLSPTLYSQSSEYDIIWKGYDIKIQFNKKAKKYRIDYQPEEGDTIQISELKFARPISQVEYQVLTKDCKIKYYNTKLDEIKLGDYAICGFTTEFDPNYEIIRNDEYFFIEKDVKKLIDFEEKIVRQKIDSVKKNKIDDIHFINNYKIINELSGLPTIPIVVKNGKKGILENGKVKFYDNLELVGEFIRLTENGLKFYYGVSKKAKYIKLERFEQELAFFIDQDGKQGYLDKNGIEYYCSQ